MQHIGTKPLETERLILRRYRMQDANDMFANWVTDQEVTRFWNSSQSAAVHYLISRAYWNQGLMSEACKRVIEFAFHYVGFQKIYSYHHCDNPASGRVMQKCGMKFISAEYKRMDSERLSGEYHYYEVENIIFERGTNS